MNLIELVAGVFTPAAKLIDDLHTSEEERLEQKAHLLQVQATVIQHVIQQETETLKSKAQIVKAEASSDNVLASSWRPIVMLSFCALAVMDSMGYAEVELGAQMWNLLTIGLGGYVVGRSGEKIARTVIQAKVTGQ